MFAYTHIFLVHRKNNSDTCVLDVRASGCLLNSVLRRFSLDRAECLGSRQRPHRFGDAENSQFSHLVGKSTRRRCRRRPFSDRVKVPVGATSLVGS